MNERSDKKRWEAFAALEPAERRAILAKAVAMTLKPRLAYSTVTLKIAAAVFGEEWPERHAKLNQAPGPGRGGRGRLRGHRPVGGRGGAAACRRVDAARVRGLRHAAARRRARRARRAQGGRSQERREEEGGPWRRRRRQRPPTSRMEPR